MREYEPGINCLNATGLPHPLKRTKRVPYHDTTQIIPSDGYNEKASTTKTSFVHPSTHAVKEKKVLSMIHRYNLADLNLTNRTAEQPADMGFRTLKVKEHQADWSTTNGHFFGQAKPNDL